MKKLLYVTNQICGPGGLERVLSIKTSFLINKFNYEIHILTLNQGKEPLFFDFNPNIIHHDINVQGNPFKYFSSYRKGLKATFKKVKPNIILVCDDGLKGLLIPIIIGKPCKMIYERHVSKLISDKKGTNNFLTKIKFIIMNIGAKSYDKFVVLTNGNKNEWELDNLAVISNPLPFFPEESSSLKNNKIISVGKLSTQKGFDLLIKAWSKISHKYPSWVIEIYGKGNDRQMLESLIKEHNLEKSFLINEPTKDIISKYLEASFYVMASRFEGFGMVLIEAMACGLPCISFDCPHGPGDIVIDNKNGYLVEHSNITLLSEKICLLIEDEVKRSDMALFAKENVTKFSPENIVNQWDNLFTELLKS